MCRDILLDDVECNKSLLSAHYEDFKNNTNGEGNCESVNSNNLIYLNEVRLPNWIKNVVDEHQWSKGKLNCKNCLGRIGSFDYISGKKCDCSIFVLPPVRLIKSKIDLVERDK